MIFSDLLPRCGGVVLKGSLEMSSSERNQSVKPSYSLRTYEPPKMDILALSVVTLGGTPGNGDSSDQNQNFFDGTTGDERKDPNDDWGYDY